MKFFVALLVLAFAASSLAVVYDHCSLARELKQHNIPEEDIATWVCLAEHESGFSTHHVGVPDPSNRLNGYGIFQIQENIWCTSAKGNMMYGQCRVLCTDLLSDDLSEDIKCANFMKSAVGFFAWPKFKSHCHDAESVDYCF